jgi:hypothetical protein
MFNFNINFNRRIQNNLPKFLKKSRRYNLLRAMVKPFKEIYTDFLSKVSEFIYKCRFNGEVIYLETALNDRFDPVNRAIYISDANYKKVYIYLKTESKPALILYMKWKPTITFPLGSFCWYQGNVYLANTPNINKIPGVDLEWTAQPLRKAPILRKKVDYAGVVSFYVNVPSTLVFSAYEMNSLIKYYKIAGPGYAIRTF